LIFTYLRANTVPTDPPHTNHGGNNKNGNKIIIILIVVVVVASTNRNSLSGNSLRISRLVGILLH
jgi:hypothetical protein